MNYGEPSEEKQKIKIKMHVNKLKKSDNDKKKGTTGETTLLRIPMERCRPHTYMGDKSFEVIINII